MRYLLPSRHTQRTLLAVTVALVFASFAAGADASFPGRNGRIVFTQPATASGLAALYSVGPDGHGLRRVGTRLADNPAWSPDGRSLAFSSDGALFISRPDGAGARRIVKPGEGGAYLDSPDEPSWSADGRRLVFTDLLFDRHCTDTPSPFPCTLAGDTGPSDSVLEIVDRSGRNRRRHMAG